MHIDIGWLESVDDDGTCYKKGHYVEATESITRASDEEFCPWYSLWHVQYAG